jgi:uncharacterized BrkB/YihY/UPF0761 family membrane protein
MPPRLGRCGLEAGDRDGDVGGGLIAKATVAPWTALVPGALLSGVGLEVLHLVGAYVMRRGPSPRGTDGALGAAAALLLGLFFLSRLMVSAAVLDATLWERRTRVTADRPVRCVG